MTLLARLTTPLRRQLKHYLEYALPRDIELARQRKAVADSADFVDRHMPLAKSYPDKFSLLAAALSEVTVKGLYCEFGVFQGETINFIASRVEQEIHGFDSFEGLPEDWRPGFDKGTFRTEPPQVRSNVRLHPGWFEDSLPRFMHDHPEPVAFLHIDADLYSSAKTVLELLSERIQPGTVIQFDEFFNFPGWAGGEYRAFAEFCAAVNLQPHYIGFTRSGEQAAARITRPAA
jgi:hypothetical protein